MQGEREWEGRGMREEGSGGKYRVRGGERGEMQDEGRRVRGNVR